MKWFLAKLIAFAILIGLVLALQSKGGMVSLWWDDLRVDLSLATAIFAQLALLFVVVLWVRTWDWLRAFPIVFVAFDDAVAKLRDFRHLLTWCLITSRVVLHV